MKFLLSSFEFTYSVILAVTSITNFFLSVPEIILFPAMQEVDLLLNDGSKHINILDWRKNTDLPQRVEMGRRHSRRCLLMSLTLASTPIQQVSSYRAYCYLVIFCTGLYVYLVNSNFLLSFSVF